MTNNLKNEDYSTILSSGKRFGYNKKHFYADFESLELVATYYAVATMEEKRKVLWWWIEGVRDYAIDTEDVDRLTNLLRGRAHELETQNA